MLIVNVRAQAGDAYELVRKIKADPQRARIGALAIIGLNREADRHAAVDAGFDALVGQPIDFPELLKKLHGLLAPAEPAGMQR